MNRFHKYLLIDTETANGLDCPICYNFAGSVIDQHGNVYENGNFVNADVFFGMPDLMNTAYYAEKIPQYMEQIRNGEIVVATWYTIKMWVKEMCEKYNIKAIIAHNARFDYKSCTTTQRFETCSAFRYFFPFGVEIWDTLKMAEDTICKQARYIKWCNENGYCRKNGKPRATAEILFRYINKDNNFVEEHKAMEDVEIERQIFWHCIRQHKPMARKCFKD
jgi:hypothetical protein